MFDDDEDLIVISLIALIFLGIVLMLFRYDLFV